MPLPAKHRSRAKPPVKSARRPHVPQLLRDIADLFGMTMALKLTRAFGGQYIRLPIRAMPSHPVARATSVQLLAWLIQSHPTHARIVCPLGRTLEREKRIIEAERLSKDGLTASEIAARMKMHVRTVHQLLRVAREG